MKKRLTLNENLFEGIISHRGRNKLSKYLKEDDNLSIQDKFNYLKSYPTYNSRSGSGKAYTRPCKVYDLGLTDKQREEFFKFLEDGGLEAFWNAHEYDSLNIYQEGRMGGHLILDPQIVDPYVFDEFDSYEEYLQDYLDSNYYPDLETAEGDLEYSSEQIENATSEVNSEISGAYDALFDFDNRVDALIRDLKGTLDLRINDPDVDNLDEDQTLNEKKSKQITADDIYQALEKVGYHNIYANSKGNGYYISKKFEKNLQKAKDILDQYGINYNVKPSQDRFYLNMEFTPEQIAESLENNLDKFLTNPTHLQTYETDKDGYHYVFQYDKLKGQYGYQKTKGDESFMGNITPNQIREIISKNSTITESVNEVKNILQPLVTKDGKVRALRDSEKLPRGFRFKSGTSTSGEVSYKGTDYAYAIVNGKLKVMTSAEAGDNWSETIYKESIENVYQMFIETIEEYADEYDLDLDNLTKHNDIIPEAGDYYRAAVEDLISLGKKWEGYFGKISHTVLDDIKEMVKEKLGIGEILKKLKDNATEYLTESFKSETIYKEDLNSDLEETDEIDEIIAQLKDDGYELDNDQDILQGLGADLGYDKEEQIKLLKAIKSRLSAKSLKEEFNQSEIDFIFSSKDEKYPYMILSRLKSDCDYYLGAGNKADKHLWALNPKDQIAYMRAIYDRLEEKPEWLTSEQIDEYEKKMIDNSLTESTSDVSDLLDKAYNGSYYTIIGAGGNLDEWKNGYQELLNKEGIGTIKEWITFNGADMNNKYQLKGDNAYPADLTFLAFPLDGLNIGKLAMFKLRMEDRWFDDIVDNNKSFNESYSSRLQKLSLNETFKVVDKNGKKVPQGGGFTSKKEAEMFAAQYGEKDLKVVSESFEDEHLGEVSKKEFTVTAVDKNGSTYLGRIKAKDNKEAEDKFAKEKGSGYKILGSHETTPDEIRKGVRLIEDIEMIPETPQTDSAMGIAGVINNLIIDEFEAIDGYNSAIITAEKEGITDIVDVLKDIVNEENIHVGQLQTCLTKVSPNAQSIDDGQVEAQQQLDNVNQTQATQEVTEAFDVEKVKKRIARVGEFDNGYVLFKYEPISSAEAEERAKQMSLKYPDDTYYVAYDNVMEPMSSIKWRNGQQVKE